ncbi:MAG: zinc ribbon domain-containing protein, partial [Microcystis sp. LE19-251.1A]|nr:zinc ribbon domain-containing protein [Microcystis sp. LE19-251.1A]
FSGKKSLKALSNKVFIFIQQTLDRWFPSSKRCSNCGYIAEKMPLNVREWDCPDCGTHHDRDVNASKNILAAGLAVSVCRATIRPEQSKSVALLDFV